MNRRNFILRWFFGSIAFLTAFFKTSAWTMAQPPMLHNSNFVGKTRSGKFKNFYVNFWKTMRRIRPETWTLRMDGLCEIPLNFTLAELKTFPVKLKSRA